MKKQVSLYSLLGGTLLLDRGNNSNDDSMLLQSVKQDSREMARPNKQEIMRFNLERTTLLEMVRSRTAPHGLAVRARITLASADGEASISSVRRVGVSMPTVGKWRNRFCDSGLVGMYGEHRFRCPGSHDDGNVADRRGKATLFAALDVAAGTVLSDCKPRHRYEEFLVFLKHIDRNVPTELDVHVIADSHGPQHHPKAWQWLAKRPRFTIPYTPTYASWLNRGKRWFGHISEKAIRRGSFQSVKEPVAEIEEFVAHSNDHARPFMWTATADSIRNRVERRCQLISWTGHWKPGRNTGSEGSPEVF